jgi:hypothetical protein
LTCSPRLCLPYFENKQFFTQKKKKKKKKRKEKKRREEEEEEVPTLNFRIIFLVKTVEYYISFNQIMAHKKVLSI